jgi:hypothetical protein
MGDGGALASCSSWRLSNKSGWLQVRAMVIIVFMSSVFLLLLEALDARISTILCGRGLGVIGAFMSYLWLFWCYNKLIFYLNTPFILFLLWSLTFLFMFDQSSYSKY